MKKILLFLLVTISLEISAQNILISDSAACRPYDTVMVSIDIENANQFISFQFDLQIPDKVAFIGYTLELSNRSTNHVAIGNLVGNNIVRILAYSPNNAAFTGNSGKVLSLKLVTGDLRGVFPLTLSNAIIGDSLSKNILTGIRNGPLSVYPLGINENQNPGPVLRFNVFPNPVRENSMIEFSLKYASAIVITLNDNLGRLLFSETLGEYTEGEHCIKLPAKICSAIIPGAIYHLGLEASPQTMSRSLMYTAILK